MKTRVERRLHWCGLLLLLQEQRTFTAKPTSNLVSESAKNSRKIDFDSKIVIVHLDAPRHRLTKCARMHVEVIVRPLMRDRAKPRAAKLLL